MGCARENGRRGGDGAVVVPPGPRDMPPSHTLTHEIQHTTRATRQAAAAVAAATARDSSMGGVFSRGRTHDSGSRHTPTQNVSGVTGRAQAASPTPRSPTTPTFRERTITTEELPLPPYVRQKQEPTKRYSGFGHVQSDNVRKMRDVWGSRREPQPPPTPPKSSRVPASPPPIPRRREAQSPRRGPDSPRRFSDTAKHRTESPSRGPESPRRVHEYSPRRGSDASPSSRRGPDSPKRGPDSPKRSFFSRDSPTRDSGRSSKNNNTNFYSSTISSRNKNSSSPRRGSTSSTEGTTSPSTTSATTQQPSAGRTSTSSTPANSSRPQPDKYRSGGWPGNKASPGRTSRRTPPQKTSAPPPPSTSVPPPPASPFHHKVFRRLRDANLQPESETISFTEEDDRYKLVMDVEEYVPGEIEVLQDDKELTVKGRIETTHRGNTTTRTFHRKFHIPKNTREEDIDSALSKDGILTVYVPKKRERVIKIELTD